MRLIHTTTLEFREFFDAEIPPYSILSHRWTGQELSYKDACFSTWPESEGSVKVKKCCELSKDMGYDWTWIDTCCIDKMNGSELTEAINSMFNWYRRASCCLAFLQDVAPTADHEEQSSFRTDPFNLEAFGASVWFTRGWTLQELIAPPDVLFYDNCFNLLGSRPQLAKLVSAASGVDSRFLRLTQGDKDQDRIDQLRATPVARRMYWASRRETSRAEDTAYCLLGLFDINMPLLYGEGAVKAFIRLQREIFLRSHDGSIYVWSRSLLKSMNFHPWQGLLAPSPALFADSGNLHLVQQRSESTRSVGNMGLELEYPFPKRHTVTDGKVRVGLFTLKVYRQTTDASTVPPTQRQMLALKLRLIRRPSGIWELAGDEAIQIVVAKPWAPRDSLGVRQFEPDDLLDWGCDFGFDVHGGMIGLQRTWCFKAWSALTSSERAFQRALRHVRYERLCFVQDGL
ncbi:uncharacterized protein MYCGRDRAFT_74475 [Zymoseptoria tritici IPO323]|uniref:Heterokaryon incompatibility domain-containing protein n=1 Tax=Zymoseptoria tritici (strain CBS 115943 / IPO323) TaxID=336722 RepID=F9XIF1_ZYMTI|nr:uncharacterized protein MYCGRDRAFT_74475 [Zymoseptoria tritici IPO323]EGP84901.1 hypothetical protein MYCGRDRAFT_74475 [Zymoseptoria tritici IPO323]